MAAGLPAGITALIVGLQPILIATVVGPLLGERVGPKHWLGLALGFLGVALVLWDKLDIAGLESWGMLSPWAGSSASPRRRSIRSASAASAIWSPARRSNMPPRR